MSTGQRNGEVLRLGTKEWIWLIVVIASAAVGNVYSNYQLSADVNQRIIDLDEKWQQRVAELAKDVTSEIRDVRDNIPPGWFHDMVKDNREQLKVLSDRIREIEKADNP